MTRVSGNSGYDSLLAYGPSVYGTRGWFTREDITHRIKHVQIVSSTAHRPPFMLAAGGTYLATVTAGLIGLLTAVAATNPQVEASLTVFMDDGSEIYVETSDKALMRALKPFMTVRGRRR